MLISHVFVYTMILYLVGQLFILHREHHVSGVWSVLLVALAQGLIVISALELGERGAHLNVIILLSLLNVTATTFNTWKILILSFVIIDKYAVIFKSLVLLSNHFWVRFTAVVQRSEKCSLSFDRGGDHWLLRSISHLCSLDRVKFISHAHTYLIRVISQYALSAT